MAKQMQLYVPKLSMFRVKELHLIIQENIKGMYESMKKKLSHFFVSNPTLKLNPGSPASISLRVCLFGWAMPVIGLTVGEGLPELSIPDTGDETLLWVSDLRPVDKNVTTLPFNHQTIF